MALKYCACCARQIVNEEEGMESKGAVYHTECFLERSNISVRPPIKNVYTRKTIPAQCMKKTHCQRGHEFTAENSYESRGYRECRKCRVIRAQERAGMSSVWK